MRYGHPREEAIETAIAGQLKTYFISSQSFGQRSCQNHWELVRVARRERNILRITQQVLTSLK